MRAGDEEKTPKKVKMKGGLGWIRGSRGQEQDMSSLALNGNHFFGFPVVPSLWEGVITHENYQGFLLSFNAHLHPCQMSFGS